MLSKDKNQNSAKFVVFSAGTAFAIPYSNTATRTGKLVKDIPVYSGFR
jgi:hypothetical protein